MSWARYDDELAMNHKVVALRAYGLRGTAALGLHLLANTWCRHNGTAGRIAPHVPAVLVGKDGPKLAAILVEVGMFDRDADGWEIHDYGEFHDPTDPDPNRSAADRKKELSVKRSEAGRLGGLAKAGKATSKPVAELQQTPSPVPVPDPEPICEQVSLQPKSLNSDAGEDGISRINNIADDYVRLTIAGMERRGEPIKAPAGLKRHLHAKALDHPDLERWVDMFPTAPSDAIAAWLLGDKGSMKYFPRKDELATVTELHGRSSA